GSRSSRGWWASVVAPHFLLERLQRGQLFCRHRFQVLDREPARTVDLTSGGRPEAPDNILRGPEADIVGSFYRFRTGMALVPVLPPAVAADVAHVNGRQRELSATYTLVESLAARVFLAKGALGLIPSQLDWVALEIISFALG